MLQLLMKYKNWRPISKLILLIISCSIDLDWPWSPKHISKLFRTQIIKEAFTTMDLKKERLISKWRSIELRIISQTTKSNPERSQTNIPCVTADNISVNVNLCSSIILMISWRLKFLILHFRIRISRERGLIQNFPKVYIKVYIEINWIYYN